MHTTLTLHFVGFPGKTRPGFLRSEKRSSLDRQHFRPVNKCQWKFQFGSWLSDSTFSRLPA